MLPIASPALAPAFPYSGSLALFEGRSYRVIRHHRDGTAYIASDDPRASGARTVPIAALSDPAMEGLDLAGLDRWQVDQLRWLHAQLRGVNSLLFPDLLGQIRTAAEIGLVPTLDGFALAGLLRRLGWRKTDVTKLGSIWSRDQRRGEMVL